MLLTAGNSDVVLWNAPGGSADQDILPFKETLDLRARDATRNDAFLSGAVEARQTHRGRFAVTR